MLRQKPACTAVTGRFYVLKYTLIRTDLSESSVYFDTGQQAHFTIVIALSIPSILPDIRVFENTRDTR